MAKIKNISGFPEWLPQDKLVEEGLIKKLKQVYESFGFTPLETCAVELVSTLTAKGMTAQEIYGLHRLQAGQEDREAEYALHFDLTVPFARYVAQHLNELDFPFKRYQVQKVWRGERPQRGRSREFYQCDVDIIGRETLPLSADAEAVTVLDTAFVAMNIAPHHLYVNSRKILQGLYQSLSITEEARPAVIGAVDKLHKIGADGVAQELRGIAGVPTEAIPTVLESAGLMIPATSLSSLPSLLTRRDPLLDEGIKDLEAIFQLIPAATLERVSIDFSLARGLTYYTGLIVEVRLPQYPAYGSVGGGGRYEDLASAFLKHKLPGVGVSVGLTRLMELVVTEGLLPNSKRSPSKVLVSVFEESARINCNRIAHELRQAGISAEVYLSSPKLGKQIEYAERKGIRWVLFPQADGGLEVKDLETKQQMSYANVAALAETIEP